ncbi:hypothetical protein EW146_g3850 [Bondarzewia mesenterica]|uniref:Aminotransferase class I/classII domain-containing protein n=1 Tax=Bondarzewia mesenterica TaxID=1095465 RepID=A0A4S4LXL9_9AGAM|nr:hypothetical protein EW146_g3850 [Bondarzewia mesenterica]
MHASSIFFFTFLFLICSSVRTLFPLEKRPGVISLLAGKPNGATFPLSSLSFTVRSPIDPGKESTVVVDGDALLDGPTGTSHTQNDCLLCEVCKGDYRNMSTIGQAARVGGSVGVSITSGSQDAIYKAVSALLNPGDSILVERLVYARDTYLRDMIEVGTDAQGIVSSSLRSILQNWPASKPKPKALYTVPYGGNPTGMTASLERRLETLSLARQHDFIILEGWDLFLALSILSFLLIRPDSRYDIPDDPYYFLYFGAGPRIPSYFTLEAQTGSVGHVLRFDSFSKILSAGIRIGFVTGPQVLVAAIDVHKRDVFEAAMRRHLDGLAEWSTPHAGMFFWFKLLLSDDPNVEANSSDLISNQALEGGVLALPGTVFIPNGAKTAHIRAAFSLLDEKDVDEALRRLRLVILKERGVQA